MPQSNDPIILALRPRRFSETVGNTEPIKQIWSRRNNLPRAWMFTGESGGGKTTLARILAVSHQIPIDRFGEPTDQDWKIYGQLTTEINASEANGVDEIGQIAKNASHSPMVGSYRVIILDEAHRISAAAQNLLLKHFEDGPKTTVWMICTTEPGKIIPTLRNRCTQIKVAPMTEEHLRKLILRAKKHVGTKKKVEPLIKHLYKCGVTSARTALQAFDNYCASDTNEIVIADPTKDYIAICQAFVKKDWPYIAGVLTHESFSAEDGKQLHMILCGYLRKVIASSDIQSERCAAAVLDLTTCTTVYDGNVYLAWLLATLKKHMAGR